MKKTVLFVIVFAMMFVMMSISAYATDLTLFGGAQDPGEVTLHSAPDALGTVSQIVRNPLSAGTFGIRFGSGNVIGHEGTLAYTPNFIDSNSSAFIMNSNLMVVLPFPIVKPYVTAGIGTFIVSGSGISDIGTKFAYNYGGGVKLQPSGPLGLRADLRGYTLTSVNGKSMNAVEVSLGVLFHF
jgi:opacity protein-like surface antigen